MQLKKMVEAAMGIFGSGFNPMISIRALTFFKDGNLSSLDPVDRKILTDAVAKLDLNSLEPLPCVAHCLCHEEGRGAEH